MSENYYFIVYHNADFIEFQLNGNKTLEDIKIKIFNEFAIYPSKQRLEGLSTNAARDDQELNSFLESNENILWVKSSDETNKTDDNFKNVNMEFEEEVQTHEAEDITASVNIAASVNFKDLFVSEYGANHVTFHSCTLNEAIVESCFAAVEHRKVLALYLHHSTDAFAKMFCPTLCKGNIRDILEKYFYFVGWDLSIDEYHSALKKSLSENVDASLANSLITKKNASLLIIYPIENSITLYSVLCGPKVKTNAVFTTLELVADNFKEEIKAELELKKLNDKKGLEHDIGSKEFQQMMCNQLGDRDYDKFEFDEHHLLKSKIGFSKFGPPQSEDGYDAKKLKEIEKTFKQIQEYNNRFAEWNDQIVISFLYNCLEPLPKEKLKREKKYSDYNPNTDINPIPIYVIRKCHDSKNPCKIYIDSDNRVYESWKDYIEDNKFLECTMVLPKDGRYSEKDGSVLLEQHLSPACGIGHQILKGTDIASTVLGLASGGVLIAATVSTIAVAPVALAAAGITGIGVGLYSLVRSGLHIYDRHGHGEDMSFANSDSRGAYINIVAGTLGFVGAGATTAVSQLASQGVNLGQGARIVVNTLGVANIGASGIGIANSSYQIYDDWVQEDRKPSLLTIVQLSSSILFFGNAVYNFRSVNTIIEESQTGTLKDIQESLRSGRHRKTFDKLTKETIRVNNGDVQAGRSEVISTMRNMGNRDEVMAVLTRNNKLFNQDGIRFSANNGDITLNGIKVDILEFGAMGKQSRTQILTDLPGMPQPNVPPTDSRVTLRDTINNVFNVDHRLSSYASMICTGVSFVTSARNILEDYSDEIQNIIIKLCKELIYKALQSTNIDILQLVSKYFMDISNNPLVVMLEFVVRYFRERAFEYEEVYNEAKEAAKQLDNFSETDFNAKYFILPGNLVKTTMWFERAVYHLRNDLDNLITELLQFTMNIISQKILDLSYEEERHQNRVRQTVQKLHKIPCTVCQGYYFSTNPPKENGSNFKKFFPAMGTFWGKNG